MVYVAALHAVLERFGGEVHHHGFLRQLKKPIGNSLADDHAGKGVDGGRHAFDVLDVHGGDHVDVRFENFQHVFVALAIFAAGDVGVRKLVNQGHLRACE